LIIIDGSGTPVYFLSSGENNEFNTSTGTGPNNAVLDYYTDGYAYVQSGDQFFFFDPIFSGTETPGEGSQAFDVKGNAEGGFMRIYIGYDSYVYNELTGHNTNLKHVQNTLEISDGSKATVACKLAAGTYTQSFTIWAAGTFYSTANGSGVLTGTVTCSGTQVGGSTFLDPFNGFGNYDTDFTF